MLATFVLIALAGQSLAKVEFGGQTWNVKSGSQIGPGPNDWSPQNVHVTPKGLLLKLTKTAAGKWQCAEVSTVKRFGFGTYTWVVDGIQTDWDPKIVLGLFNYPPPEVGTDGTNEIDIEVARWGNVKYPNLNFSLWRAKREAKPISFTKEVQWSGPTTLTFEWTRDRIKFSARSGQEVLASYEITDSSPGVIPQSPMPAFMNLWLFEDKAPKDGKEIEILIRSFEFKPLKSS